MVCCPNKKCVGSLEEARKDAVFCNVCGSKLLFPENSVKKKEDKLPLKKLGKVLIRPLEYFFSKPEWVGRAIGLSVAGLTVIYGWRIVSCTARTGYEAAKWVFTDNSEDASQRSLSLPNTSSLKPRQIKLPREGIYEAVSEGKDLEYHFTYNEKGDITELFIEDKDSAINYLLIDRGDAKTLCNYKHLSSGELTLDELIIVDSDGKHKRVITGNEIERLEPGTPDRQLFIDMQVAFRQIYNYLGENPK